MHLVKKDNLPSSRETDIILAIGGTVYLLQFFVLLFFFNLQANTVVLGIGWILIAPAFLMQLMAVSKLISKDAPEAGNQEGEPSLVDTGIYGIVRHPLYVGWAMMTVAMALISQNLASIMMCVVQIIAISVLTSKEEKTNSETFEGYASYRERVPMVNVVAGCYRQMKTR
ncbi:isoprenylcysteine carboxylmethyltransferase family protein [Candidatus Thorarchaeota archaeon]|nr:MAG: isoprenylcysteine carboxylmethyltransferase family protein [Candidatus Thorarchaeota archaeon]